MGKWKSSIPIDGLNDIIQQNDPKKSSTINIDEVLFHYCDGNERVGTVITKQILWKKQKKNQNT